jgi:hypothetical protein
MAAVGTAIGEFVGVVIEVSPYLSLSSSSVAFGHVVDSLLVRSMHDNKLFTVVDMPVNRSGARRTRCASAAAACCE